LGRDDEAAAERAASARLREELRQLDELKSRLIDRPNDAEIETEIARWMIGHGRGADGARWAEKVVRDHPGHPEANRLLAEYHERAGNAGRANYYRLNAAGDRGR
jgi:Flp pilus assembly protein TadD